MGEVGESDVRQAALLDPSAAALASRGPGKSLSRIAGLSAPSGKTSLAAVIGWPVKHSLSPVLHNAAFRAAGLDGLYLAFSVPPGQASAAVESMRLFGWLGLSVTMPHKAAVVQACDVLAPEVQTLGVANTLYWADGELTAANTDGIGFVAGLSEQLGVSPSGLRCAIVGSGGAAKAVALALSKAGAADVAVLARNRERAELTAAIAAPVGRLGRVTDLAEADLVINATPVGMAGANESKETPFSVDLLKPSSVVADLIYHPLETPLLLQAREAAIRCINGLPMLIHQAAAQFKLFTGVTADVTAMSRVLDAELQASSG